MTQTRYDYELDAEELEIQKEMDEYLTQHPEILQWAHKNKPEVLRMVKLAQEQYKAMQKNK